MADRPILFKSDMVRAILEGRKTQTRRIIKPQPRVENLTGPNEIQFFQRNQQNWAITSLDRLNDPELPLMIMKMCSYGVVGDRLWVREAFQIDSCAQGYFIGTYQADSLGFKCLASDREIDVWDDRRFPFRKTSGRFMYKSLARLWLEITGIRVERAQNISEEDAKAEGLDCSWLILQKDDPKHNKRREQIYKEYGTLVADTRTANEQSEFAYLWDSINAKRGYSWKSNPWVWVIKFRKVKDGD